MPPDSLTLVGREGSAAITQAVYQHWFPKERTGALDNLAAAVLGQGRETA